MNSELQKQFDELKAEREAEREKLSKQRKEREAALEAKRREMKIQTVMSQRRDFTRGDAEFGGFRAFPWSVSEFLCTQFF
jgi:hypothetical protein